MFKNRLITILLGGLLSLLVLRPGTKQLTGPIEYQRPGVYTGTVKFVKVCGRECTAIKMNGILVYTDDRQNIVDWNKPIQIVYEGHGVLPQIRNALF